MMVAQFHNELTPDARGDFSDINMEAVAAADHSYVYQTDDMYIIFPQYDHIDFDFGTRPDRNDESITLCTPACMCYKLEFTGTHQNVLGDHAIDGTYYRDANGFLPGFGGFAFYDGNAYFETHNKPRELIRAAAEHGGDGFGEYVSISDGEIWNLYVPKLRSYRLLAELNGRVCIIDSTHLMAYSELVAHAQEIGVTQALYLDVGGKLNYSWYRDSNNHDVTLMGVSVMPFAHNWITFRVD